MFSLIQVIVSEQLSDPLMCFVRISPESPHSSLSSGEEETHASLRALSDRQRPGHDHRGLGRYCAQHDEARLEVRGQQCSRFVFLGITPSDSWEFEHGIERFGVQSEVQIQTHTASGLAHSRRCRRLRTPRPRLAVQILTHSIPKAVRQNLNNFYSDATIEFLFAISPPLHISSFHYPKLCI